MGQVVQFAGHRAKRAAGAGETPRVLAEQAYFCVGCDTDRFLLYPDGRVQCARCGSLIENLRVADDEAYDAS